MVKKLSCTLMILWMSALGDPTCAFESTTYTPPNYYAVIVGVADYPNFNNDLTYPAYDASCVRDALLQYPNWQETKIQLLLNNMATRVNIQNAIYQVAAQAANGDVFLFYYSGHGSTVLDQAPFDERDLLDETLCAYDEDIRDDELNAWVETLGTSNVVVIIDSCFSGGQIKAPNTPGLTAKYRPGTNGVVLEDDDFAADLRNATANAKDMGDHPGCIVVTGSRAYQLSYEVDLVQHGLFSFFVLAAINGFYDLNSNGQLSAEEIGLSTLWSFWSMYAMFPGLYVSFHQFPQYYDDYPAGSGSLGELPLCMH